MGSQQDVIVCGGGPSGIAAAVAAARAGARTLLIERYGFLGGGATAMNVNPFMTYWAGQRQIIAGVFQEWIDGMTTLGGYGSPRQRTAFDPEAAKYAADKLCEEAGVRVLFHTCLAGTVMDGTGARINAIRVANKTGLSELEAPIFVDATGDADLAFHAGATVEKGRREDGLAQPMTMNFRMAGVDIERMPPRQEITERYLAARERGEIDCPREDVLWFHTTQSDVIHFNTTRVVKHDATDPWQLSEAERQARRQVWQFVAFLKREIPGFENAYLQLSGPQIGVRETRRVLGEYVMTEEDCLEARKFDDVVARGSYPVDIHNPAGGGTVLRHLPPGEWYEIPYRCLVPRGIENLLIGGRPVSCTHEAHSAIRVMPIAMAMGQAAGAAAAQCQRTGATPRTLDVSLLQQTLVSQGASLGERFV